jgi:hypothetical protein
VDGRFQTPGLAVTNVRIPTICGEANLDFVGLCGDFACNISAPTQREKLVNRIFGLAFAVGVLCCGTASAQVSDGVVKLGVLNDMWRTAATADMIRAY